MAIETAESEVQTKLNVESHEEKLTRLFMVEMEIQKLKDEKEKKGNQVNALKNEIKAKEKDKVDLLNNINSGQGTIIPVAVSGDQEDPEDEDSPSDEELAEFEDQDDEEDLENEEQESDSARGDSEEEPLQEADSETETEEFDENMPGNMSSEEDVFTVGDLAVELDTTTGKIKRILQEELGFEKVSGSLAISPETADQVRDFINLNTSDEGSAA